MSAVYTPDLCTDWQGGLIDGARSMVRIDWTSQYTWTLLSYADTLVTFSGECHDDRDGVNSLLVHITAGAVELDRDGHDPVTVNVTRGQVAAALLDGTQAQDLEGSKEISFHAGPPATMTFDLPGGNVVLPLGADVLAVLCEWARAVRAGRQPRWPRRRLRQRRTFTAQLKHVKVLWQTVVLFDDGRIRVRGLGSENATGGGNVVGAVELDLAEFTINVRVGSMRRLPGPEPAPAQAKTGRQRMLDWMRAVDELGRDAASGQVTADGDPFAWVAFRDLEFDLDPLVQRGLSTPVTLTGQDATLRLHPQTVQSYTTVLGILEIPGFEPSPFALTNAAAAKLSKMLADRRAAAIF